MVEWLAKLGRWLLGWYALLMVVVGCLIGFGTGEGADVSTYGLSFAVEHPYALTPHRLVWLLIGGLGGMLVAGAFLGLAAAIYDIQRTLRLLTEHTLGEPLSGPDDDRPPTRRRVDPRL